MKKFKRSHKVLVPVVICSMMSFLSCSHRPPTNGGDDLFGDMKQSGASPDTQETAVNDPAKSSEAPTAEVAEQKAATMNELTATADTAPKTELSAADLEAAQPTSAPEPKVEAAPEASIEATDMVASNAPVLEEQPGEIVAQAADAQPLLADSTMPEAVSTETSSLVPETAATEVSAPEVTEAKPERAVRPAKVPQLPKATIWKKGQTMNRYYFVRPNDTPESVSEMIYGTQDRAKDLVEWNGKSFHVGKLLLFVSPENASDTEMKSIFEERKVATEEYVVQKGDWLSKIANTTYGSGDSWREIASVNGLESPDKLDVGDKLTLFPNKIPAREAQVAKADTQPAQAPLVAEAAPAAPAPVVAQNKAMPEESEEGLAPLPQTSRDLAQAEKRSASQFEDRNSELASPEIGSFFERHFAAIMSALVILIAGFLVIRSFGAKSRDFQD